MFEQLLLQDGGGAALNYCRELFFFYDYCSSPKTADMWSTITNLSLILGLAGIAALALYKSNRIRVDKRQDGIGFSRDKDRTRAIAPRDAQTITFSESGIK
jgi:hypothetical protein